MEYLILFFAVAWTLVGPRRFSPLFPLLIAGLTWASIMFMPIAGDSARDWALFLAVFGLFLALILLLRGTIEMYIDRHWLHPVYRGVYRLVVPTAGVEINDRDTHNPQTNTDSQGLLGLIDTIISSNDSPPEHGQAPGPQHQHQHQHQQPQQQPPPHQGPQEFHGEAANPEMFQQDDNEPSIEELLNEIDENRQ